MFKRTKETLVFDPASPFTGKTDPLRPAQKTSFAEDRLKVAVQSCELPPGSIATEAQISERFGLGRRRCGSHWHGCPPSGSCIRSGAPAGRCCR